MLYTSFYFPVIIYTNRKKCQGSVLMSLPARITVAEAGRRGGQSTLENQGVEFFRKIGKRAANEQLSYTGSYWLSSEREVAVPAGLL